jgi:hypothetical protein
MDKLTKTEFKKMVLRDQAKKKEKERLIKRQTERDYMAHVVGVTDRIKAYKREIKAR